MSIFSEIRNLFGIRKDHYDTKKTKLEIEKLEEEKSEKKLDLEKATLDDIYNYDPKSRKLLDKIKSEKRWRPPVMYYKRSLGCFVYIYIILFIILVIIFLIYHYLK